MEADGIIFHRMVTYNKITQVPHTHTHTHAQAHAHAPIDQIQHTHKFAYWKNYVPTHEVEGPDEKKSGHPYPLIEIEITKEGVAQ
eukprot:1391276-Amorphochlora_amoeboformis.AAC.1